MLLLAEWIAASPASATTATRITKRIEVTWSASSLVATMRQPATWRSSSARSGAAASGSATGWLDAGWLKRRHRRPR